MVRLVPCVWVLYVGARRGGVRWRKVRHGWTGRLDCSAVWWGAVGFCAVWCGGVRSGADGVDTVSYGWVGYGVVRFCWFGSGLNYSGALQMPRFFLAIRQTQNSESLYLIRFQGQPADRCHRQ